MRFLSVFPGFLLVVLALALTGCGGGGNGTVPRTAKAVITIQWPARSRLIPEAANSIQIIIADGSAVIAQQTVARPAAGGNAPVTFTSLPVGNFTVSATAFPNADGTGTAQATATTPLALTAGQTTYFALTMGSTIDHLELTTPSATLASGSSEQLSMVAKDATGAVVLTSPDKIQWSSSDTTKATVDNTGKVTGALMGAPTITVTDTESGKSATSNITVYVVVTVSPATQTLTLGDAFTFTAGVVGSANQAVNWSIQEGASGGSITTGGVYTAPQQQVGTFHIIAASQADTTRTSTATVTVQAGGASVKIH